MDNGARISVGREILSWVVCIASAVIIAVVLRVFVFELVSVDGSSMEPTLHDKEVVFVEKISTYTDGIGRFDIVIVKYPGRDGAFIKRVVGLPGDKLTVHGGYLYVNGDQIIEGYTLEELIDYEMDEITVPENCYFVMGDNRNNSMDSTSSSVGPIPSYNMVGKVLFVVSPIKNIQWVS